jgi:hypothetical protein
MGGTDPHVLEDIRVAAAFNAFSVAAPVTARDIHIDGPANGFSVTNTQLTLERARLVGRTGTGYGITGSNATLNAMNVLISGFEERGIEWPTGSGSVDSSTIVDTGSGALDWS